MSKQIQRNNHNQLCQNKVSSVCSWIVVLISVLLLVGNGIIEYFYSQPSFILGVNFIKYIHSSIQSQPLTMIMFQITYFGSFLILKYIIILYLFLEKRKILICTHLIFIFLGYYFTCVMKQIFQHARPLWYDPTLTFKKQCHVVTGNPSTHSFTFFVLFYPLFSDSFTNGKMKCFFMFLLALMFFSIPFSRLYVGAHSTNQVLFGLSLSTIFTVLFRFKFQRIILNTLWDLYSRKISKNIKSLVVIIMCHAIALAIPTILYIFNTDQRPLNRAYVEGVKKACGDKASLQKIQFHDYLYSIDVNYVFGLFYGFTVLGRIAPDSFGMRKYLFGHWNYQSIAGFLLRSFLVLGASAIVIVCYIPSVTTKLTQIQNYYFSSIILIVSSFLLVVMGKVIKNGLQIADQKEEYEWGAFKIKQEEFKPE